MSQIKAATRIERFAECLKPGAEVTASHVTAAIGNRNITERSVGLIFRSLPCLEMVPVKRGGRSLWRRV
jgi:hypothetical protein